MGFNCRAMDTAAYGRMSDDARKLYMRFANTPKRVDLAEFDTVILTLWEAKREREEMGVGDDAVRELLDGCWVLVIPGDKIAVVTCRFLRQAAVELFEENGCAPTLEQAVIYASREEEGQLGERG